MIDPILVGMRHAVDANTPDSSNVINTSSIVQVKHDLMRYRMYKEYMKNSGFTNSVASLVHC
jgi:hypothetical protein